MTPPEFEAAAGCSKGKNWKVSLAYPPVPSLPSLPVGAGIWHCVFAEAAIAAFMDVGWMLHQQLLWVAVRSVVQCILLVEALCLVPWK